MDLQLAGKRVVVTGGSRGIGYAIAEQFLREGAIVTISGRDKAALQAAVDSLSHLGNIQGISADATNEQDVLQLAASAAGADGNISAWVNNVGSNLPRRHEFYTDDELDILIASNFKSVVYGCQSAIPYMKENGGSIVNIASLAAHCASAGRATIYSAMKAGVVAYSRTLAGEYGAWGIRVNSVLPGFTATPLVRKAYEEKPDELAEVLKGNLVGHMAEPEEIAGIAVFLASPAASYITAAEYEVTGGHNRVLNPQYSFEKKRK